MKMNRVFAILFFLTIGQCQDQTYITDVKDDSYKIIDYFDSSDCSIYAMKFKSSNDILFRISTSGACAYVEEKQFLDAYKEALKEYSELGVLNGKYIILEFPSRLEISKDTIRKITKNVITHPRKIKSNVNKGFDLIEVYF